MYTWYYNASCLFLLTELLKTQVFISDLEIEYIISKAFYAHSKPQQHIDIMN